MALALKEPFGIEEPPAQPVHDKAEMEEPLLGLLALDREQFLKLRYSLGRVAWILYSFGNTSSNRFMLASPSQ